MVNTDKKLYAVTFKATEITTIEYYAESKLEAILQVLTRAKKKYNSSNMTLGSLKAVKVDDQYGHDAL